jgi:hypothetical protein
VVIGDSVVIWRTWAVYQRRLLAILVPRILLLVLFGEPIKFIRCAMARWSLIESFAVFDIFDTIGTNGTLPGGEQICPWTSLVVWGLSVVTNVTYTILIGFKAWYAHISHFPKHDNDVNSPGSDIDAGIEFVCHIPGPQRRESFVCLLSPALSIRYYG